MAQNPILVKGLLLAIDLEVHDHLERELTWVDQEMTWVDQEEVSVGHGHFLVEDLIFLMKILELVLGQISEDHVQTSGREEADLVQTSEDLVQTSEDLVLTSEDLVLTLEVREEVLVATDRHLVVDQTSDLVGICMVTVQISVVRGRNLREVSTDQISTTRMVTLDLHKDLDPEWGSLIHVHHSIWVEMVHLPVQMLMTRMMNTRIHLKMLMIPTTVQILTISGTNSLPNLGLT